MHQVQLQRLRRPLYNSKLHHMIHVPRKEDAKASASTEPLSFSMEDFEGVLGPRPKAQGPWSSERYQEPFTISRPVDDGTLSF